MTDAPRLVAADELRRRVTHAPLFTRVRSRKLRTLLEEAVRRMSGLGENAEAEYQRALAALRDGGRAAIDALGREFAGLPEDQPQNRWAVVQLLADLRDPDTLGLLDKIVSAPLPVERSSDPHGSPAGRELVIRTTAVEAIGRLAADGSAEARSALLRYADHPVRSVRIAATLEYLERGGSQARRELLRRLSKADQWMLDIHRAHPQELPPLEGHRFLPPRLSPGEIHAPRPVLGDRAAESPTDARDGPAKPAKRPPRPTNRKG